MQRITFVIIGVVYLGFIIDLYILNYFYKNLIVIKTYDIIMNNKIVKNY